MKKKTNQLKDDKRLGKIFLDMHRISVWPDIWPDIQPFDNRISSSCLNFKVVNYLR